MADRTAQVSLNFASEATMVSMAPVSRGLSSRPNEPTTSCRVRPSTRWFSTSWR
jgi:hypothetical protein